MLNTIGNTIALSLFDYLKDICLGNSTLPDKRNLSDYITVEINLYLSLEEVPGKWAYVFNGHLHLNWELIF